MDNQDRLAQVTKKIDNFNAETKLNFKLHVEHELTTHKKILPKGLAYGAVHEDIETAVDDKMAKFMKHTNLKPQELADFLEKKLDKRPDLTKRQLHYLAYEHLEKNTKSKFLKKIYKSMRKRMK